LYIKLLRLLIFFVIFDHFSFKKLKIIINFIIICFITNEN
jgi:hypothetical protein